MLYGEARKKTFLYYSVYGNFNFEEKLPSFEIFVVFAFYLILIVLFTVHIQHEFLNICKNVM